MKLLLTFFICLNSISSQAQNYAGFTTFYATDARGNVDSVQLAWHDDASSEKLFTQEGEINMLSVPFDTLLDFRLSNGIGFGARIDKMNKRFFAGVQIGGTPFIQYCKDGISDVNLLIHAKYPPVEITWDSTFFSIDNCFRGSAIVNHDFYMFSPNTDDWIELGGDSIETQCMIEDNKMYTDLSIDWRDGTSSFDFTYNFPLINGDTVLHGVLALLPSSGIISFCNFKAIVSTEDELKNLSFNLSPNPVSDILHIKSDKNLESYQVLSMSNQIIKTGSYTPTLNVEDLPKGIYFLKLWGGDSSGVKRFIKF